MNLVLREPDAVVAPSVIRVLGGPGRGAELMTPPEGMMVIGGGLDSDVVLQGEGARALRLEFEIRGGLARLGVGAGTIELLGHAISAPGEVILPPFVPFAAGEVILAYGEIGHHRWAEAQRLADRRLDPPAQDAPAAPARSGSSAPAVARTGGAALAFALCGALLGVAAATPFEAWFSPQPPSPTRLAHELAAQGLPGLAVRRTAAGLEVRGVVADRASETRLLRWAGQQASGVRVKVVTNRRLADEIAAAFRNEGLTGGVSAAGLGAFVFRPDVPDAGNAEVVRRRVLAADPAIGRLDLAPPTRQSGSLLPGDSGKQIRSAVPGPDGHVLTADGEGYFVGAELPGGARLSAVEDHRIVVERDGATTTIDF